MASVPALAAALLTLLGLVLPTLLPSTAHAQSERPPRAERPARPEAERAGEGEEETARPPGAVVGRVVDDATGKPVEGVAVQLNGPSRRGVISGAEGGFRVSGLAPGVYELVVSHIAYGEAAQLVNVPSEGTVELEVRVVARAIALDSIVVKAEVLNWHLVRGGYYDRKRRSVGGTFMDGGDLPPVSRASIMLAQAPFVELRSLRSGFSLMVTMRQDGRSCVPDLFIDGRPVPFAGGRIDDHVFAADIEAIEVYRGVSTPAEFVIHPRVRPCGAIVIWRKRL